MVSHVSVTRVNVLYVGSDSKEEEDEAQQQPASGGPRGVGDGLKGAQGTLQKQLHFHEHEVSPARWPQQAQ